MSTSATSLQAVTPEALRLQVSGQVQGVGFRPFVYQLAQALGLRKRDTAKFHAPAV
jgi:hypothetical protein